MTLKYAHTYSSTHATATRRKLAHRIALYALELVAMAAMIAGIAYVMVNL